MTIAFMLIISCAHPTATALMRFKTWERCHLEKQRYYEQDDPKHTCLAMCVGDKVYQERWVKK